MSYESLDFHSFSFKEGAVIMRLGIILKTKVLFS